MENMRNQELQTYLMPRRTDMIYAKVVKKQRACFRTK
jgi:hypothetical protein